MKTPIKTIRAYCLSCCGDSSREASLCACVKCSLYPYRLGKRPAKDAVYEGPALTPIKAIRARCLDCSGGSAHDVKNCFLAGCALQPYRLGKNPNISAESREKARQRSPFFAKTSDVAMGLSDETCQAIL